MTRVNWFVRAFVGLALCAAGPAGDASAADWPQWRYDAERTAVSPEELPATLKLQWVRELPKPAPAWAPTRVTLTGGCYGMYVDQSHEAVVMGKTVFVSCNSDDSVTALDTESGELKWRFHADAPVRHAPIAWEGKVYFDSDDSCLYCVDAEKGTLLWKFFGAPMDHRSLGDERLISAWPARGGPVLADGTVYYAAGLWPHMGIMMHALDARTGKPVWTYDGHKSGGAINWSPQGYLAVAGTRLMVGNMGFVDRQKGQAIPQSKDKLGKTVMDDPSVSCFFPVRMRPYLFLEGMAIDKDAVYVLSASKGGKNQPSPMWVEGFPKTKETFDALVNGARFDPRSEGGKTLEASRLWKLDGVAQLPEGQFKGDGKYSGGPILRYHMIKAGSRLYASSPIGEVYGIDVPAKGAAPKVTWTGKVEGESWRLIAADGKLFVITMHGKLYCFGSGQGGKTYALEHAKLSTEASGTVAEALKQVTVQTGYALVLDNGSGRLTESLVAGSKLNVVSLVGDRAQAEALRQKLDAAGVYGKRAHVLVGAVGSTRLPPYLFCLMLADDAKMAQPLAKLCESLRPYGGVLCLAGAAGDPSIAGLAGAAVEKAGPLTCVRRAGALPGSADWTHQYCDAGNSLVSADDLVKPPFGVLWWGGPTNDVGLYRQWREIQSPVVSQGRQFFFMEHGQGVVCTDIYTGQVLWTWQTDKGGNLDRDMSVTRMQMATAGTDLYVWFVDPICFHLDAATGELKGEYKIPADACSMHLYQDYLVACSAQSIAVLDRNKGTTLWSSDLAKPASGKYAKGLPPAPPRTAVGGGKAFCLLGSDGENATLLAFDLRSGKEAWRANAPLSGTWVGYSEQHDVVVAPATKDGVKCFAGKDGKPLWADEPGAWPLLLNGDVCLTVNGGKRFSLQTGQQLPPVSIHLPGGASGHGQCNYRIGSKHLVVARVLDAAWCDIDTGKGGNLGVVRSGCTPSMIVADGLVNIPRFSGGCSCPPIHCSISLVPTPDLGERVISK